MKTAIHISILICLTTAISFAQKETHTAEYEGIKATFETTDGRFNGNYISFYKNGQKCAEGRFENNFRIGTWSVWDSTGNLRVKRYYEAPFLYQTTFPKAPNTPLVKLLNIPQYYPLRNKEGFFDYHYIHERMVYWEQRIWRFIPNEKSAFPDAERLFKIFNEKISTQEIKFYQNDAFEKENKAALINTDSLQLIGLKIKEVSFFDTDRFLFETRIIGICPVVIHTASKDTMDLYWVYYPETRPFLAKEKIENQAIPNSIQNLDDVFFFRYFPSRIYKKHNIFDREIPAAFTKENFEKESNKLVVYLIEMEHGFWTFFSQK